MELSPILLSKLLFYSFLWGIALGVLNDVFRITRVVFGVRYSTKHFEKLYEVLKFQKKNDVEKKGRGLFFSSVIFLQDIFSTVIAACGIVILCYYLNDGKFRFFTVVAMSVGAVLWYMSFGKIVMMFSEPIVVIIKFVFRTVFNFLTSPIRWLAAFCVRIYKKIFFKLRKAIANNRNIRYNRRKKKYYADLSRFGFMGKEFMKG